MRRAPISAAAIAFGGVVFAALVTSSARAQDASLWDSEPHTSARLIGGDTTTQAGKTLVRAGIEISLDSGWHTYWRDPGDTGVPPGFDFSGSDNVKSATVEWPAPLRFPDGAGGNSIGYVGHVVLPVEVAPRDASKPSLLHLKLHYAICGNLCIPAEADLHLDLSGKGAEDATIETAQARVPQRVALGQSDAADHRLAVLAVHREAAKPHDRVVVDIAASPGAPVDLFVEGPTPDWSLPQPEPAPNNAAGGAMREFTFDLDGLPSTAKAPGATLTFTAVSTGDAIEVPARLD